MGNCFLIQPFDGEKFDKRFKDVFSPAIVDAKLEPYRVDRDPEVEVPIQSIEEGIRDAAVCLADITTDNPNVWYELGYAFAAGTPVIMLCSSERSNKYPFDIQHRTVIRYKVDSTSDFNILRSEITNRINAILLKRNAIREVSQNSPLNTMEGLDQSELVVLATIAGDMMSIDSSTSIYSVKNEVEKSGFTPMAFNLGYRRLYKKHFIQEIIESDYNGNEYQAVRVTDLGWDWIENNEDLFVLKKAPLRNVDREEDIPF